MNSPRLLTPIRTSPLLLVLVLALAAAGAIAGCKGKSAGADDAALNQQVQSKLYADPNLSGQGITATVASGVVTLSGNVSSDTARNLASGDVAQVAGIKTVVNNLVVQAPPTSATAPMPMPMPASPMAKAHKPTPAVSYPQQQQAPIVRDSPPPQQQYQPPVQAQLPPPPPAPTVHTITLPAGTSIPVRITESLDSATTQTGDKFTGTLASDLIVEGLVVLTQGTSVTGQVDEAKDATHFKGSSLLTLSLTSINRRGDRIQVATDAYTKQGEGRGKNTAEKVGGGAAVGAILGGIFGGGKGAAIGAAAGGGVGAGANGISRGQQVQIPSETVVRFRLSDAIQLRVTTGGGSNGGSNQGLERRNNP